MLSGFYFLLMTISTTVSQSALDFQLTHEIDENADGRLFRFEGEKEEKELILKGKKKRKRRGSLSNARRAPLAS